MGYKKVALKGIGWITLLRVLTRGLTFVRLAILGRLLTPLEFGYFGIASLLLALLEIFTETGINVFLVQYKGKISEYINSAWVVSIVRGVILSLLIILFAPLIAQFFNSPESLSIILLVAFVPFIRGFINPAIISYQKDLYFDKEFKLRSFLFLVDVFISILFGFITRNATAFVYGMIASAVMEVFLSFVLIRLKPKVQLELAKIRHVLKRGWAVTITGIFSYFADNSDNIAVGKIIGSPSLGIYQVAYKFSTLPISEITNVVNQVIFPVLSKFADDKIRLKKAFAQVTISNTIGAFIFGAVIFIFAKPIILLAMGEQWEAAVPAVRILAIYGILRTIFGSFSALFLAVEKQEYVAKMLFIRVIVLLIVIIPLVPIYGMVGAAYAMLISVIFEIPVILYFTYKVLRHDEKTG